MNICCEIPKDLYNVNEELNDYDLVLFHLYCEYDWYKEYYLKLREFLKDEYKNHTVYPGMYDIFNAFKYTSYNDFFIRKVIPAKRPINAHKNVFISPCDSKLTVYEIKDDLTLKIKNSYYSIDTLVDNNIMNEFKGGFALVFRLSLIAIILSSFLALPYSVASLKLQKNNEVPFGPFLVSSLFIVFLFQDKFINILGFFN